MPVSVDVMVSSPIDCVLPHPCSDMLHAAIFRAAQMVDAELTTIIHDAGELKPFTLSTLLQQAPMRSGDKINIVASDIYRFRLTTLNVAAELFITALQKLSAEGGNLRIGKCDFILNSVDIKESSDSVVYADLPQEMESVSLKFLSPTTFRRAGLSYPLPDPVLVFSSLWRKWCAYSDYQFGQPVFDELISVLALARADVKTRTWKFPRYQLTGFTGTADFMLTNKVSADARMLLGALANYARFASVGLRTTMGMGQCAIDKNPTRSLSGEGENK